MADNYRIARDRAREYFLSVGLPRLFLRPGITAEGENLRFTFLGAETTVSIETGRITFAYPGKEPWEADFSEALSVYDWLCDAKPGAFPAGVYCPINSLPGLVLGGNGSLKMDGGKLNGLADRNPEGYRKACEALGAAPCDAGDIGYKLNVFPDLAVILKFYHSDEDFPAQLTILWDRNTLDFVKYETSYYIAGVMLSRIREKMGA